MIYTVEETEARFVRVDLDNSEMNETKYIKNNFALLDFNLIQIAEDTIFIEDLDSVGLTNEDVKEIFTELDFIDARMKVRLEKNKKIAEEKANRLERIELKGINGSWTSIDKTEISNVTYYLLENEEYGEEVPCIIIDSEFKVIILNSYNGFLDLEEYLEQ